jgi:iron(III) transport system substrate-binding protein
LLEDARLTWSRAGCAALLILAFGAAGCGGSGDSSSDSSGGTLVLYSAQHEPMTNGLADAFEKATGADVRVRFGEDEGLANQIAQEGSASPADVFLAENAPPLLFLAKKGLLTPAPSKALASVPQQYSAADGDWVGVAARETALIYDPRVLPERELPKSVLDLADPSWKGKLAIAPSEPDFVPLVGAISALKGQAATERWLKGFAANAKRYNDNEGIVAAVEKGQIAAGVINHYYWFSELAELGAGKVKSKLYHFGNQDPGALVDVSGAGVLASSDHKDLARRFLDFITSVRGQNAMVAAGDWEYPLNAGAKVPEGLKPFDQLDPPDVSPAELGDGQEAIKLIQQAGLL